MGNGCCDREGDVSCRFTLGFIRKPSHRHVTIKHTQSNTHTHTHTHIPPTYSNLTKMIFIEFVESLVYLSEITTHELDDDEPLLARMQHLLEKLKVLAITRRSAAAAEYA